MKKSTKLVLLIAIILILSSVLILTIALQVISNTKPTNKPYEGYTPDQDEVTTHLQQIIKKKFDMYTRVLKDDNTLVLFVGNSYHQLHDLKFNNKLDPLSYDEIVYLINDTIDLYFRYDYIQYDERENYNPLRLKTYHGDFTEFSYSDAVTKYQIMKNDIYHLILFRIMAFDGRFRNIRLYGNENTPTEIDFINSSVNLPLLADAEIAVLNDSMANVSESNIAKMMVCHYYKLPFDKIANPPSYDYDDIQINDYGAIYASSAYSTKENEKILYIAGNGKTIDTLYPTKKILDRCPKKENHKAVRSKGEEFVAKWMPEYDFSQPTPSYQADAYLYFIKKGMSLEDVVTSFGIPYDGSIVDTTYVAKYITTENQVLAIWLRKNHQGKWEVYDLGIFLP